MNNPFSVWRIDSSEEFRALIKNLPGMAYRCANHPDWPMDFVSEGSVALTGFSPEEFTDGEVLWGSLIHEQDKKRVWRATQQALKDDVAFEFEYRIVTRSGEQRWVWERGRKSARSLEAEEFTRLDGIISDISDRKLIEEDLDDARSFSHAVVDAAVEAVITIDVDGRIETFNSSAEEMFGHSAATVIGRKVDILMPEPFHSEHADYLARFLASDEPRIIGVGREVLAKRSDGSVFPIHLSVNEFHFHQKRKFVGLIRDISERRAAERKANEQLNQLAHVDRLNMLGEMASGISHEINQPITAISLFSQAGKRFADAGRLDKLPEIFEKLSEHAQRAGEIMERMQTLARRGESSRELVPCNPIFQDVARLAEAEARLRELTISLQLAENLPQVNVDVVQIQQVALNFLRNAMEAMHAIDCAGGTIVTLVTRQRDDGDIEVSVIDSGCGVSDADAEKVFAPFSTTKESGMGMGLVLSKTIINAHGGQLDYRNNEVQGATFFFTLPAAE